MVSATYPMMVLAAVLATAWCQSFSFGTSLGQGAVANTKDLPSFASFSFSATESPLAENLIGSSPCPRGRRGFTCRQQLAKDALTCSQGSCQKCRNCESLGPSEWPGCCRDHFLCCRPLASACQQCDVPQLFPFCEAAFKRCN
ncbi:unnamed protein product [Meganyctiphanes norvegica]|uniref:Uncharacterized protein n=1 Tax=Meganyctiphanes norvegica TaxID=48144 RepID=A0AAV2QY80_MEGNR